MTSPVSSFGEKLDFARAYPPTGLSGDYRKQEQDFLVTERLGYDLSGSGEHLYLLIEKINTNTDYLANQIARELHLPERTVGYAGKKDRFAITRQWFSVHLPGKELQQELAIEGARVIESKRHQQKLRRGELEGNEFQLRLDLNNPTSESLESLKARLELIKAEGFPNYFGAQRFGHDGQNLEKAERLAGKNLRRNERRKAEMWLSAARSYLFNKSLERLIQETGDRHSYSSLMDAVGALPGDGLHPKETKVSELEAEIYAAEPNLKSFINAQRTQWAERALWALPESLEYQINTETETLELAFFLKKGVYATSLLRELGDFSDAHEKDRQAHGNGVIYSEKKHSDTQ